MRVTYGPENEKLFVTLTIETNQYGKNEHCRNEGYKLAHQNLKRRAHFIGGKWVKLRVTFWGYILLDI